MQSANRASHFDTNHPPPPPGALLLGSRRWYVHRQKVVLETYFMDISKHIVLDIIMK